MKKGKAFLNILLAEAFLLSGLAWRGAAAEASLAETDRNILYVDENAPSPTHDGSTWGTAFNDLQDALAVAYEDHEIWVAEGIYYPGSSGERTASFQLKNGVGVYGGFPTGGGDWEDRDWQAFPTILSGDIDRNDITEGDVVNDTLNIVGTNAYHVVTGNELTPMAILDGFIITAGHANGAHPDYSGGGMYNYTNSHPTLKNIVFTGNSANTGGGIFNFNASPSLMNITFIANSAILEGGGMSNYNNSNPSLTNVSFSGNTAKYGGGMRNFNNSIPTLTNVILWGNIALDTETAQIYGSPTEIMVTYSIVQGESVYPGLCNSNADPLFVDPENGDLRLQSGSPAIDAGNSEAAGLIGITTDLDGSPRFVDISTIDDVGLSSDGDPVVDMGAYEFHFQMIYLPLTMK